MFSSATLPFYFYELIHKQVDIRLMSGMKRRDVRALDHKTLEEIRVVFVEFLKRVTHKAAQPILHILDGDGNHRSRQVKDYVASLRGKLRLFSLPPIPRN
jgi:hypothetical protein